MENELIRTVKYALVAISAGAIQFGSFALLNELTPFSYWPCYLISLLLSVVWNFTVNRRYTFKSTANVTVAMLKVLGYYAVFTPVSTLLGNWLVEDLLWNSYLVEILCMLVNGITEFLFQRFYVFGKTLDSNDLAKKKQS